MVWLWRLWTLPNSMLGLLLAVAAVPRGRARVTDGVLEVWGGGVAWLLRRAPLVGGGAAAMTLGHVVLGVDEGCLERTRAHERAHVRQAERWGPFFLPAYCLGGVLALVRGGHAYRDNPFEVAARACEDAAR